MELCLLTNKNKKAQVWGFDLVVALVIFLVGIIVLFYYAANNSHESENKLEEMFYEANLASNLILSEENFGILTDNEVNQTKLNNFSALDDSSKRNFIGLSDNFYFSMDNLTINGSPQNFVGIINTSNCSASCV